MLALKIAKIYSYSYYYLFLFSANNQKKLGCWCVNNLVVSTKYPSGVWCEYLNSFYRDVGKN